MTNNLKTAHAFLLHRRSYDAHGLLLDFFSKEYGVIRCINRYIRKAKTSIQPFIQLQINFRGKGELKTLTQFVADDSPRILQGDKLFFASYINELLMRLLAKPEPYPAVFSYYHRFLEKLQSTTNKVQMYWLLRCFEKYLLDALGLGLDYEFDSLGHKISSDYQYYYQAKVGFVPALSGDISGKLLYLLAQGESAQPPEAMQLKICRILLQNQLKLLLGHKPIKSRLLINSGGKNNVPDKNEKSG